MRYPALRLALLPLLAACGGAPVDPPDASGLDAGIDGGASRPDGGVDATIAVDAGPVDDTADPEALAAAYRREACAKARHCESIFGHTVDVFCHPGYRSHVWEEMLAAWRAGRARYDADAAQACLDAIASEVCVRNEIDPPPLVCLGAVVGTVPDGGECERGSSQFEAQCASGLDCVTEGVCPGRCEPRSDEGEACSDARRCTGRQRCRDGVCVDHLSPGDPCTDFQDCGPDYICYDRVCAAQPGPGEPCGTDAPQCAYGSYCGADVGGEAICLAYGTEEGEPCRQLYESCVHPLVCMEIDDRPTPDLDGVCTRGAELGEPCDDRTPCGPGGRCVELRCAEIVDPARQCDAEHVCPSQHDCVDGICVPRPAPGEACGSGPCAFSECVDGVCNARYPDEGERCDDLGYQCDIGLECGGDPADPICRVPCG